MYETVYRSSIIIEIKHVYHRATNLKLSFVFLKLIRPDSSGAAAMTMSCSMAIGRTAYPQ